VASVQADSSATSINNNVDTKRNEIIEAICEKLEEDTARNSKALHSEITGVTVDDGTTFPVGQATITYSVQYKYTRGTN
jgi:chorismate mutase